VTRYPIEELTREIAFIAYHFHWSKETITAMPHRERHRWVAAVSTINREINELAEES